MNHLAGFLGVGGNDETPQNTTNTSNGGGASDGASNASIGGDYELVDGGNAVGGRAYDGSGNVVGAASSGGHEGTCMVQGQPSGGTPWSAAKSVSTTNSGGNVGSRKRPPGVAFAPGTPTKRGGLQSVAVGGQGSPSGGGATSNMAGTAQAGAVTAGGTPPTGGVTNQGSVGTAGGPGVPLVGIRAAISKLRRGGNYRGKNRLIRLIFISGLVVVAWHLHQTTLLPSFAPSELPRSTGTSTNSCCLREISWHPVTLDARETVPPRPYYPDFASTRILHDGLSRRVNHNLSIIKNVAHLKNSSTVNEMQGHTFEDKCVREPVPKKLHWIWFGAELPAKYVSNIEKSAMHNPGWEVFLWSELPSNQLKEQLEKYEVQYNFRNVTRYLEAGLFVNGDLVESEKNLAGKSDYLRLEVVHMEGGIYQDTDARSVHSFDEFGDLFRWPFASYIPTGNLAGLTPNAVFGFAQDSTFLSFALNLTRENCLTFHHCGVMTGAGPDFLTAAFYFYDDPDIVLFHQDYLIEQSAKSVTYHTNDATWVAEHLASNGGHW